MRSDHAIDDLYDAAGAGIVLAVHTQAGAGRSQVVGRHGAAVKVRVAAPPIKGRANDAVRGLLAESFGVDASAVELVAGEKNRAKRFRISGIEEADFVKALRAVLGGNADTATSVQDIKQLD